MTMPKILTQLADGRLGRACLAEPLRCHSRWRIGGPADLLVEPEEESQISELLRLAKVEAIPVVVIGTGSNLLFSDAGLRGMVIKLSQRFARVEIENDRVTAQAGAWIPSLARRLAVIGLSGIEHTIGIPSTLGGLIAMNGGSQRRQISEVVESVRVMDHDGAIRDYSRVDCGFARRTSAFQGSDRVILGASLCLSPGNPQRMRVEMLSILKHRRHKFPLALPNAGSVFVSGGLLYERFGPPGRIIEECGLKGLRIGGAEVSPVHANFIVNTGCAQARDVLGLIHRVRMVVFEKTGIWMHAEVRYVASSGRSGPAHLFPASDPVDHGTHLVELWNG